MTHACALRNKFRGWRMPVLKFINFVNWITEKIVEKKGWIFVSCALPKLESYSSGGLVDTSSGRSVPFCILQQVSFFFSKLPNSEQSYKGKVKTHNYINRQNQSTTEKLWKRNDPDLVQAFLKKWWVEYRFNNALDVEYAF
jgi:hypothetical protein